MRSSVILLAAVMVIIHVATLVSGTTLSTVLVSGTTLSNVLVSGSTVSNVQCHDNHGAWGGDCVQMINNYRNDFTIQRPDKNGRVGIYYSSCLGSVNYFSNSALYNEYGGPVYSNSALAEMAFEVYARCFQGNEQIYKSGVGYTDRTNTGDGKAFKFCLSNNKSGGSC